jgi:hypothetical protein
MQRKFATLLLAGLVIGGAGTLAAPMLVQKFAESKVDDALGRIGRQTTSMVNRGDVSVDVRGWSVSVRNVVIEGANRESRSEVGTLTIERPSVADDQLSADRVVFEDVTLKSAGETITIPRLEIDDYSGPERGLTATPGVGRNARSQADLIAKVSLRRGVAPVVTFSGDTTGIRRTIRNATFTDVVDGVVASATVDALAVEAPYLTPEQAELASSVSVTGGPFVLERLDLPTLWRFYAGDGAGDRESFLKRASIANLAVTATLRPGGRAEAFVETLRFENVALRPLTHPVTTFDPIAAKLSAGEALTPAEIREQLLFGVDLLRAVSFDRIAAANVRGDVAFEGAPARAGRVESAEIGPYADGRIDLLKATGFSFRSGDDRSVDLASAEASAFDARGLLAHAERIGRDEILMTTSPTAAEVVKAAPRIGRIDLNGVDVAGRGGALKAEQARIDVDAPLDAVPQRVAFKLDGLYLAPSATGRLRPFLDAARLEALRGSAAFQLTLDPEQRSLSLDDLDYRVAQLGVVKAKGELAAIDPLLAVASGAELLDKISAVELGVFKATIEDDGAVELLLRRAAEAAGTPAEIYREQIARDAQEQIFRLFGPPTENSAEAAASFIRDPRILEITLTPQGADQKLLDLIRAFDLGPAGLAQVVDLSLLAKR